MLSVIIPIYNRAHIISRTINSVLRQSIKDWELIIVDDGSSDATDTTIRQLKLNNPAQSIHYLRQPNAGPSAARNTGVTAAQGDIIVYLDSDDCLYPSALEDIRHVMRDQTALYGIANHNRTIILQDNAGQEVARKYDATGQNATVSLEQIYNWEIKTTSSGLFHRRSLLNNTLRWRSGFYIEDLEFLLQLAAAYPRGFRHIPKVLIDYKQVYGGDGLCSRASYADWAHAFDTIYQLHEADPLMKRPEVYLDRVAKYRELHSKVEAGLIQPPQFKYFPDDTQKA